MSGARGEPEAVGGTAAGGFAEPGAAAVHARGRTCDVQRDESLPLASFESDCIAAHGKDG